MVQFRLMLWLGLGSIGPQQTAFNVNFVGNIICVHISV